MFLKYGVIAWFNFVVVYCVLFAWLCGCVVVLSKCSLVSFGFVRVVVFNPIIWISGYHNAKRQ